MKELGLKFKEQREKMGLSLGEVSMSTKINAKVLKAIEEGDEANLPAKTFLRGFIRTYANYLKMDTPVILKEFKAQMGSTQPEPTVQSDDPSKLVKNLPDFSSPKFLKKSLVAAALLVVIVAIVMTKNIYDKYSEERILTPEVPTVETTEPREDSTPTDQLISEPTQTPPDEPAVIEKVEVSPPEKEEAQPVVVEEEVEKPETPEEPEKIETPPPEKVEAQPVAAVDEVETEAAPKPPSPKPVPTKMEVILEALDSLEVDYRIDGGELKYSRLSPDETLIIKGSRVLNIDVSNAGAVNIIYNGQDRGVPGDIGKTLKLRFPPRP